MFRYTTSARMRYTDPMTETKTPTEYLSQAARDACDSSYGDKRYWDYLDRMAREHHDFFMARGDTERAESMFTQSLSASLQGNDGA